MENNAEGAENAFGNVEELRSGSDAKQNDDFSKQKLFTSIIATKFGK